MPTTHPVWLLRVGPTTASSDTCLGWQDVPIASAPPVDAITRTVGPIAAVHCSDLKRTRQSARPIARALSTRVHVSKALRDADHGDWTGLSWGLIERQDTQRFTQYMDAWATTPMPGGESYADVHARVSGWWSQLSSDGPVLVVSDLQPLRAIGALLCGWTAEEAIAMHLARGHLACFDPKGEKEARWNLAPGSALAR
jgi:broad specificity phosphatase PhoE